MRTIHKGFIYKHLKYTYIHNFCFALERMFPTCSLLKLQCILRNSNYYQFVLSHNLLSIIYLNLTSLFVLISNLTKHNVLFTFFQLQELGYQHFLYCRVYYLTDFHFTNNSIRQKEHTYVFRTFNKTLKSSIQTILHKLFM